MMAVCVCSFSCHTQTNNDMSWKRGQMHRNKSWLRLQRNCPSLPELNLEVLSCRVCIFSLYYNVIEFYFVHMSKLVVVGVVATVHHLAHTVMWVCCNHVGKSN